MSDERPSWRCKVTWRSEIPCQVKTHKKSTIGFSTMSPRRLTFYIISLRLGLAPVGERDEFVPCVYQARLFWCTRCSKNVSAAIGMVQRSMLLPRSDYRSLCREMPTTPTGLPVWAIAGGISLLVVIQVGQPASLPCIRTCPMITSDTTDAREMICSGVSNQETYFSSSFFAGGR